MSTKPIGGEVIEPYANPELLAPGTVRRPAWINEATWARMPWPARWKAARRQTPPPTTDDLDAADGHGTYAGYIRHKRDLETPCIDCLDAMRAYSREKRGQTRVRVRTVDEVLVDRFIDGVAHWSDLTVDERIAAARRLDAAGISRRIIRDRTHLNTAAVRRAFDHPQSAPGRVDGIACAAQDSRRAS